MEYSEYLIYSARLGDLEAVKECLTEGEAPVDSIDADGNTALHMASANGFAEVASHLIANKANINLINSSGNTPLHWASINGKLEVVKILCEQKA